MSVIQPFGLTRATTYRNAFNFGRNAVVTLSRTILFGTSSAEVLVEHDSCTLSAWHIGRHIIEERSGGHIFALGLNVVVENNRKNGRFNAIFRQNSRSSEMTSP